MSTDSNADRLLALSRFGSGLIEASLHSSPDPVRFALRHARVRAGSGERSLLLGGDALAWRLRNPGRRAERASELATVERLAAVFLSERGRPRSPSRLDYLRGRLSGRSAEVRVESITAVEELLVAVAAAEETGRPETAVEYVELLASGVPTEWAARSVRRAGVSS